jgi:hypothetical protein
MHTRALAGAVVVVAFVAHAQLSFTSIYGSYTTRFFTNTAFKTAELNKRLEQLELLKRKSGPPAAVVDGPAHAPLAATDFTPAGERNVAQQLAGAVAAKDRAQVQALVEGLVPAIESAPGFRKNNLAAAMTVALGAALQVALEQEMSDESSVALMQALNDVIANDASIAKLTNEQRTQAYDAFLVTGGLMAGILGNAKETKDASLMPIARELSLATLKQFGVRTPKKN